MFSEVELKQQFSAANALQVMWRILARHSKKISTSDAGMPRVQSRKINKKSSAACGVHRQRINNRGEQGLQQANDNETNDTRQRRLYNTAQKSSSDVMVKSIVLYPCACDLNCIFMCCYFPSNRTSHCIVLIIEMLGKDNGFLPPPSHTVREK